MHTRIINHFTKKLKDLNYDSAILNDICRLYDDGYITNFHNYYHLFAKQISLGLTDIYDRFVLLRNTVNKRDSSTLQAYVIRFGDIHGPIIHAEKTKNTSCTLDTFIKKYGKEEGIKKFKFTNKKKTHSLESYIIRDGKEIGPIKHKEYWSTTNFSMSDAAWQRRCGYTWKEDKSIVTNQIAHTLENYIKRHGVIIGTEKYENANIKRSISCNKDSYINKLRDLEYSIDEILEYINNRWNQTSLEAFIRKYGAMKGPIRYEEYIEKLKRSNPMCIEYYDSSVYSVEEIQASITNEALKRQPKNGASKESLKYLSPINSVLSNILNETGQIDSNEFSIILNEQEKSISSQRLFLYDLTYKQNRIIIEYHGEYYHDDVDYDSTKTFTYNNFTVELYNKDLFKKFVAEQREFEVLIIRSWKLKEDLKTIINRFNTTQLTETIQLL